MGKDVKFETALQKLEKIVEQLESGETDLDKSIKMFEEGNNLVKLCMEKLDNAQAKIQQITTDK